MPRPRAVAPRSAPMDFDMEEDSTLPDALPTPESNQENARPAGKGRGRGKAAVTTTSRTKTTSSAPGAGKKKAALKKTAPKRAPLKEQSNNQNPDDTEEVDEFEGEGHNGKGSEESAASADELVAVKQPVKKARTAATGKAKANKKQSDNATLEQIKNTGNDEEFEYTPVTARQTKPPKKARGRPPANLADTVPESQLFQKVIPDTQEIAMDFEPANHPIPSEEAEEIPQSIFRRPNNAQSDSRARQPSAVRKQAGYESDNEGGGGDPALRRKLGEMTKKFESLDMRYKKLTDFGIKEADANFEKLKLSSEAKSKGNGICSPSTAGMLTIEKRRTS